MQNFLSASKMSKSLVKLLAMLVWYSGGGARVLKYV